MLHWVLLGFTGFYWVLLGFTGFYWVLLGFTGFYWVLLNRWLATRPRCLLAPLLGLSFFLSFFLSATLFFLPGSWHSECATFWPLAFLFARYRRSAIGRPVICRPIDGPHRQGARARPRRCHGNRWPCHLLRRIGFLPSDRWCRPCRFHFDRSSSIRQRRKEKNLKKKTNPWPRFCVVGAFRLVCFWLVFFLFLAGRTTDAAVMIGRRRLPRRRDVMDVASRRWRVCPSAKVRPRRLFTSAPVGFQFIDCIFLFLLLAGPVLVIFFYRLGIFFCSFRNGRSSFSFSLFRCKSLILFCWKERNPFWSYSFVFLCFFFFSYSKQLQTTWNRQQSIEILTTNSIAFYFEMDQVELEINAAMVRAVPSLALFSFFFFLFSFWLPNAKRNLEAQITAEKMSNHALDSFRRRQYLRSSIALGFCFVCFVCVVFFSLFNGSEWCAERRHFWGPGFFFGEFQQKQKKRTPFFFLQLPKRKSRKEQTTKSMAPF